MAYTIAAKRTFVCALCADGCLFFFLCDRIERNRIICQEAENCHMKKKTTSRLSCAVLFCGGILLFTGCGKEAVTFEKVEQSMNEPAEEKSARDTSVPNDVAEVAESEKEDAPNGADAKDAVGENTDQAQTLYEARVRHQYGGILSQIIAAWQLPDGKLGTGTADDDYASVEMEKNCFAVADVDQDGREELLVRWTTTITAGEFEAVYDYDPESGEVKREFWAYPALTYYDNGIIKAEWAHNQVPPAEFWPFTLFQYEPESDSYVEVGSVRAWDNGIEGWDFPDELDVDGDGTVYEIEKAGEDYRDYEGFRFNQADLDEWFGGYAAGAKEIVIDYQPMEYESFADFTPTYLRMIAEEAGRERTDTASDLGLLILGDGEEHYLDASKKLLTERYGVAIGRPEANFEEYSVGLLDGKERFSFTMLDSGDLCYMGEKVEDVTIFGIYPGISVDAAWEKLKAYGFYASPYGEVENCLITGDGFGNVSIWFEAEEGKVTTITVRPFCAFSG